MMTTTMRTAMMRSALWLIMLGTVHVRVTGQDLSASLFAPGAAKINISGNGKRRIQVRPRPAKGKPQAPGLDLSGLGPVVGESPPDVIEAQLEADGPHLAFTRVEGASAGLWYGETADGAALQLYPFRRESMPGALEYMGVARVGDVIYDISVDLDGEQYVTTKLSSEFDEEEDPTEDDAEEFYPNKEDPPSRGRGHHATMRRRDLVGADLAIRGIPQRDAGRALFSTEVVTLRIIIAWTSNTECGKAGLLSECTSLTQATWDLMYAHASAAVEVTNTAFALSGVYIQLELAYAFRVNRNDYTEQTTNAFSHAMNALRGTTDGYMDYVHAERERYQAHFVSILVEAPGQCGTAPVGPAKHQMFSVVRWGCAIADLSFPHEIAHNLGCLHDRGTDNKCSSTGFNYGFRDPDASFRTVMSKHCTTGQCDLHAGGNCPRVSRFSSASQTYNGKAIGSSGEDNVRQLNEQRFTVCNYYTCGPLSSAAPTPSPTTSPAPTYTQELGSHCELTGGPLGTYAKFDILTDPYGEETSWDIYDEFGQRIAYHEIRSYFDETQHSRYICVPSGPLTFTINDVWGDGILDPGNYALCVDDENNCIYGGGITGFDTTETQVLSRLAGITYSLALDYNSDRATSVALHDQTVAGVVYIFTTPDTDVDRVVFKLNGTRIKSEGMEPYDVGGTNSDGTAKPWDIARYDDGAYQMEAFLTFVDGSTETINALFAISNTAVVPTSSPSTVSPTLGATMVPTASPVPYPTSSPTSTPSAVPTTMPPTETPTASPVAGPLVSPTGTPSAVPTTIPPTETPTASPVPDPTSRPTGTPSAVPTTMSPTETPTTSPIAVMTDIPTGIPSTAPTTIPPSSVPTKQPTASPINVPTGSPAGIPSATPTTIPPSLAPTESPTKTPTAFPTVSPMAAPTIEPSPAPTKSPTTTPTTFPTLVPTVAPTIEPTAAPSSSVGLEYSIALSGVADRSNASNLHDSTITTPDDVFVFTTPDTDVDAVIFYLNGVRFKKENAEPFDCGGTERDGAAKPWNIANYANGSYEMTAKLIFVDGTRQTILASFLLDQ